MNNHAEEKKGKSFNIENHKISPIFELLQSQSGTTTFSFEMRTPNNIAATLTVYQSSSGSTTNSSNSPVPSVYNYPQTNTKEKRFVSEFRQLQNF